MTKVQISSNASDEDLSDQLLGSSITYRIAVGPQQGCKVFTLQTLLDCESDSPVASTADEVADATRCDLLRGNAAQMGLVDEYKPLTAMGRSWPFAVLHIAEIYA